MRPFFEAMFLQKTPQSEAVVERALRLPQEVGAALFPRMARWDAGSMQAAVDALRAPVLAVQCTYVNTERKRAFSAGTRRHPFVRVRTGLRHA